MPWAAIPRAKTSQRSALRCRCGKPRRPSHVHLSWRLFSINLWYRSPSLGFAFHLPKQTGKSVGAGGAPRGRLASSESKFCLLLIWECTFDFPKQRRVGSMADAQFQLNPRPGWTFVIRPKSELCTVVCLHRSTCNAEHFLRKREAQRWEVGREPMLFLLSP